MGLVGKIMNLLKVLPFDTPMFIAGSLLMSKRYSATTAAFVKQAYIDKDIPHILLDARAAGEARKTGFLPGAVEMERQLAEMRAELGQYLGTDADKMLKNVFHLHNLVIDMDRDLDKAAADLERMNRGPVQAK